MIIYILAINLIGFAAMWYDKLLARAGKHRIPESRLLLFAAAGGGLGVFIGMQVFNHKTKNLKFTLGVPAIIIGQILLFRNLR